MSSIPQSMCGVQLTGHGGPENLLYRTDIPVPTPGPGDVLVQVGAAGVNNTDINTRTGWYSKNDHNKDDASWSGAALQLPRIQGADVCGTIVSVGKNVSSERIGERVLIEPCLRELHGKPLDQFAYLGSECDGGFAEYTIAPDRHAYAIDSTYTDVELASFPCSYSTAENMLTRANLQSGERVLITGASGGVGSAAVQLAKARGAEVIAVTSPSKADKLIEIGADQTICRDDDYVSALGSDSIDVVIDLVAGDKWPGLLDVLKRGGRYAVAGAIAGPMVELDVRTLYLKDLSFFGCTMLEPEVFQNLISHIEHHRIQPLISQTYALKDITKAQADFEAKSHIGKLVLTLDEL